ncbi:MAG: DUF3857 domain-containing protein [Flavobacteriales bacterium]
MKKMKQVLLIGILIINIGIGFGQKGKSKKVQNHYWGVNDIAPKDYSIPEKWKGESEIVLFENIIYEYAKLINTYGIRKQIYLNDHVSIKKYSEFSIDDHRNKDETLYFLENNNFEEYFGVRIIKPDGEIETLNVKDIIINKNDEKYFSIPNLQKGDIIDFYIIKKKFLSVYRNPKPKEYPLYQEYPIKKFRIDFLIKESMSLNFKSLNGAPELKSLGINDKVNKYHHVFECENIDKINKERWVNWNTSIPVIKYAISHGASKKSYCIISGKEGVVKSEISMQEIIEKSTLDFPELGDVSANLKKSIRKDLKEHNITDPEFVLERMFHFIRNLSTLNREEYEYTKNDIFNKIKYEYKNENILGLFQSYMPLCIEYLKGQNIDYDVVVGVKREEGTIENEPFGNFLFQYLLVKLPNKELLLADPYTTLNFNKVRVEHLATQGYAFNDTKNNKGQTANGRMFSFPKSLSKNHQIDVSTNDFESLQLTYNSKVKGNFKKKYLDNYTNIFDELIEEKKVFKSNQFINKVSAKEKAMSSIKARMKSYKDKANQEVSIKRKEIFAEEFSFDLGDDFNFKNLSLGRFHKDSAFVYTADFTLKDQLIKKAGQNYIFEIGKLISKQVSIKEDELERQYDVNMESSREMLNTIRFKIPDGYEIKGYEKLIKNVDNKTGSFISTAKIENGYLIVETRKVYKSHFVPKEEWPLMVEFLDEAFQFSQENVLLQKK